MQESHGMARERDSYDSAPEESKYVGVLDEEEGPSTAG